MVSARLICSVRRFLKTSGVGKTLAEPAAVLLVGLFLPAYTFSYLRYGARPTTAFGVTHGWLNWYDQSEYYRISDEIANGTLLQSRAMRYPPGYPILSVPFASLMPYDRFFVPDAIIACAILLTVYAFTRAMTGRISLGIAAALILLAFTNFMNFLIEPWSNHVFTLALILVIYMTWFGRINGPKLAFLGLLVGWVFSARYIDAIWLLPPLVYRMSSPPRSLRRALCFLLPAASLILATMALNAQIFGSPFNTGYGSSGNVIESLATQYSVGLGLLPKRLYGLTIDPLACVNQSIPFQDYNSLFDKTPILASKSFYLIFALPGVVAEYRRQREKRFIVQLVLLGIVYFVFYTGVGCWHSGWTRYFRYHESWFPLLTVFATVGMYDIYRILQKLPKLLESARTKCITIN